MAFATSSSLPIKFHPFFPVLRPFSRPFLPSEPPSRQVRRRAGALREWREYEEAVKRKDLARALRFLRAIEKGGDGDRNGTLETDDGSPSAESPRQRAGRLGLVELERDWQVLDACLNSDDMRLVGSAYGFLKEKGLLTNFGRFGSVVLEGTREVTPSVLKSATGLEASKLAPKKWGLSGTSSVLLAGFLGGLSFLVYKGIDLRPNLAAILGLAMLDSIFLGGSCLAQISSYWPPYKRRILVHEAGHLLVAYLMGCPIRGVILDPIVAMQMGIQGQAGTQFWDEKMDKEIAEGLLSGTALDRYCMVLFAGIAAEALVYGEAEGGENDENLFKNMCLLLQPPLSLAQMANQARWSVLQAYNLLKWHKHAHRAAFEALQSGSPLSVVIRRIEDAMASGR